MSHDFPDFSIFYFCFMPFYIALAIYFLTKIPKVGKYFLAYNSKTSTFWHTTSRMDSGVPKSTFFLLKHVSKMTEILGY